VSAGPEELAEAVRRLRAGGLVAFPTETVYGLGADALNEAAVRRVFALKGRPETNPLIVHVADEAGARAVAADWPAEASRLARRVWPGPLTIVVPRSPRLPPIVTAGGPTVGVRCPDHHLTLALLEAFGGPLVGPSANPSGRVSPTTAEHVRESFAESEVYVLDGGACRGGIESTVVTLAEPSPRVLRAGLVTAAELSDAMGRPVEPFRPASAVEGPAPSPGTLPVHYAPRTPAVLFEPEDWPRVLGAAGGPVAVLSHAERPCPPPHRLIRMPEGAGAYAARLYAALREADRPGTALIAVERPPGGPPDEEVWAAIADRLARATTPFRAAGPRD
jgi:L-threonylcarbamoyladenylate synthase